MLYWDFLFLRRDIKTHNQAFTFRKQNLTITYRIYFSKFGAICFISSFHSYPAIRYNLLLKKKIFTSNEVH